MRCCTLYICGDQITYSCNKHNLHVDVNISPISPSELLDEMYMLKAT